MKISIVLPVLNGEKYIGGCIESILAQTLADFELLVVDDGSTDHTADMVQSVSDPRVRLLRNKHDFIGSLNLGLAEARGEYIARMDVDDLMMPDRLARQAAVLDEHPEIAVCASWMVGFIDGQPCSDRLLNGFTNEVPVPLVCMLRGNIISHPTVMLRTSFLRAHGLAYRRYAHAEDYKMWTEIAALGGHFWVVPEPLVRYRCSAGQVSRLHHAEQMKTTLRIRTEVLNLLLERNTLPHPEKVETFVDLLQDFHNQGLLTADQILNLAFELFMNQVYKEQPRTA